MTAVASTHTDTTPNSSARSQVRPLWLEYGKTVRTRSRNPDRRYLEYAFYLNSLGVSELTGKHGAWLQKAIEKHERDAAASDMGSLRTDSAKQYAQREQQLSDMSIKLASSCQSLRATAHACAYIMGVKTWLHPRTMESVVNELAALTVDICSHDASETISAFPRRIRSTLVTAVRKQSEPTYSLTGEPLAYMLSRMIRFGPLRDYSWGDMDHPWYQMTTQPDLLSKVVQSLEAAPFDARCLFPPKPALIPEKSDRRPSSSRTIRRLYDQLYECDRPYTTAREERKAWRWVLTGPAGSEGDNPLTCIRPMNDKEAMLEASGASILALDRLECPEDHGLQTESLGLHGDGTQTMIAISTLPPDGGTPPPCED